jgi:hypothetical protein
VLEDALAQPRRGELAIGLVARHADPDRLRLRHLGDLAPHRRQDPVVDELRAPVLELGLEQLVAVEGDPLVADVEGERSGTSRPRTRAAPRRGLAELLELGDGRVEALRVCRAPSVALGVSVGGGPARRADLRQLRRPRSVSRGSRGARGTAGGTASLGRWIRSSSVWRSCSRAARGSAAPSASRKTTTTTTISATMTIELGERDVEHAAYRPRLVVVPAAT